ncbi:serine/threonine-protein kinase [Paraglaciecola sp.]|uniref:serine/threonine-protein kinase n=1 Tax=Paraglaciecola sp. TaxID=1920173 RepID=UPI00273F763A|nr:serine/threonine-protein kinase [Paraglaciecola sp.]MDP5032869.1 protein kinase [Paraglaciecola sp.]
MQFDSSLAVFRYLLSIDEHAMETALSGILDIRHPFYNEVLALIDAHKSNQQHTEFLGLISKQAEKLVDDEEVKLLVGKQVGVYQLVKRLGVGGMGAVYLGVRNDGQLQQKVAIKFVYPSIVALGGNDLVKREAQHLADLEHVNIGKVLNVETDSSGLPYMVMEFIDGITIDQYCSENKLTVPQRLSIMLKVCRAVLEAHQNRIIHADIKPSNILVDKQGEPKLMDFGIARTTITVSDHSKQSNTYLSGVSHNFGSPEQFAGEHITTASDIYSVGKVLSHLLEHQNKDSDIQAIIDFAIQKEKAKRITSMQFFIAAIEDYLANLPLTWYRNDLIYKYQKWSYREPVSALASILLPLIVLAVTTFTLIKNNQLAAESAKNNQILSYYENLLSAASPSLSKSTQLSAASLLSYGVDLVADLAIHDAPTRDRILVTLATSLFNLGYLNKASTVAGTIETHHVETAILRANIAYNEGNIKQAEQIVHTYQLELRKHHSGLLLLAEIASAQMQFSKATDFLDEASLLVKNDSEALNGLLVHLEISTKEGYHETKRLLDTLEKQPKTPLTNVWYNAYSADFYSEKNEQQLANKFIEKAITTGEKIYNRNHPDLAKLFSIAAKLSIKQKNALQTENYLNKQQTIYEGLAPNYQSSLLDVYSTQFRYFFNANSHAQARNYNLLALELCAIKNYIPCEQMTIEGAKIAFVVKDYESAIALAEKSRLSTNSEHTFEILDILVKSYFAIDSAKYKYLLDEMRSLTATSAQRASYINNLILTGNTEQAIELYKSNKNNFQNVDTDEMFAFANAFYAADDVATAELLLQQLDEVKLNEEHKQTFGLLFEKNSPATFDKKTDFIYRLEGGHTLIKHRRVVAIDKPTQNDIATIGIDFSIAWQNTKLQGRKLAIYINQKLTFQQTGFDTWQQIQGIHWHLIGDAIDNTGKIELDPYNFMANGRNKFKILIVSEFGYWSVSDGLFSVVTGISKDNGLEDNIEQRLLVDVVFKPEASEVYNIGEKNSIQWDERLLGGQSVSIYVLHDDSRGIGNKLYADSKVIVKRRWYSVAIGVKNTGLYTLDPAQFNGQGNNYKILLVSDNGNWAVSDERFTVVNPY